MSGVLGEVGDRFPKWIRDRMPRIASSSTRLAHMRGPFVYGDEESPSPPSELFTREDAEGTIIDADYSLKTAEKFYKWHTRQPRPIRSSSRDVEHRA